MNINELVKLTRDKSYSNIKEYVKVNMTYHEFNFICQHLGYDIDFRTCCDEIKSDGNFTTIALSVLEYIKYKDFDWSLYDDHLKDCELQDKNYNDRQLSYEPLLVKVNNAIYSIDEYPNKIAVKGHCIVIYDPNGWGNGEVYKKHLINPTYNDLFKFSDEGIRMTTDFHHIFFEGFKMKNEKIDNLQVYEIYMGS